MRRGAALKGVVKNEMFIGIDPGVSGGIAVLQGDSVEVHKMPETEQFICTLLGQYKSGRVFIEQIPKYAGEARFAERNIMGSSLAVLYGNYQLCLGICLGLGNVPFKLTPLKWQNLVGCRNYERRDRSAWKNVLKAHAQKLFPGIKVTLAVADALLIAHAGRLLRAG